MPVPVMNSVSPRRLIRDEVFLRLLDAIVGGDLLPGEQLVDSEIEQWIGVSRTPVREALNQLAAMGLVEILPQKQTRVTPVDPKRLQGLIETLATLFRSVVRDTTPLLTESDIASLSATLATLSNSSDITGILRDQLVSDAVMNLYLRRLDNKTIARLATRHVPEVRRALNVAPSSTTAFESAIPHLEKMITASIENDARAASEAASAFWTEGIGKLVDEFRTQAGGSN
ncbi:GntR family transcriptional regulator [Leifsonia sp. NPDC058248]|uniref:GntR family transcriptional regulator n=1 Tax=Leifsonia sp. NPDC058248 TaxID=3346402 RepID=UPI0036DF3348